MTNKRIINYGSGRYGKLINSIGEILDNARKRAAVHLNQVLIRTYWDIGKRIVEFEQQGSKKAEYGSELLAKMSADLRTKFGKGFSKSNLIYMRLLYLKYRKSETLSHQLSWSHYFELLKIEDDLERLFYEKQCIRERWSVRDLKRQKKSALFARMTLSKNKRKVAEMADKGITIKNSEDIIKDPYILEFLGISDDNLYSEKEFEEKIIENLKSFLLELGKGFTFVARQYRISLSNTHYYVDLVFYHRILKCFVLIDLKINEVTHQDIGQMNMYLNYFKDEEMAKDDKEPIGIILSAEKDHLLVKYALGGLSNKLFVSKYKLYLPTRKELEMGMKRSLE